MKLMIQLQFRFTINPEHNLGEYQVEIGIEEIVLF